MYLGRIVEIGTTEQGCRFHPRGPVVFGRCPVDDPHLPDAERGAACWLASGV